MKLVREHMILEKFTEDSDPVYDMGIGIVKNLTKIISSILETDASMIFYTVELKNLRLIIYFNSPNMRETRNIFSKDEALDYCKKILYDKLGYENIFVNPKIYLYDVDYPSEKRIDVIFDINDDIKNAVGEDRHIKVKRIGPNWKLGKIEVVVDNKYF